MREDFDSPARLAISEVTAALDAINSLYAQMNFSDVLAKERNLKKGANAARFLLPLGSTIVVQLPSSPIVSTLGPLAAALAAGSPTIVLGGPSIPATSNMLECIILEALDREAFHLEQSADVSTCEAFAQAEYATVVLHSLETSDRIRPLVLTTNPAVRLIEPYYGIPAGVIDRSVADAIDVATERIRLAVQDVPKGNISRVPRLFFVDDSIFTPVKNGMQAQREVASINLDEWLRKQYRGISPRYCMNQSRKQRVSELPAVQGAILLTFSSNSEIVLVPTRSLDHTIDLLNKINASTGSQVIYIFARGKEGFYLGNFITTSYVYLNDVPVDSLILTSCRSANATTTQGYYFEDFSEMKVML
ncbi:hypothetical protein AA0116_g18 [Alternaria tenuissima]|nr:hypothetical protein AA0116_g18 [Alternaria tenuissima]